ncbi:MAG: hypothetical protein IID15_02440 [Candidatus Marinimicrobia bacterium]|nr:hypothetical protein [Candidatus Neomarinimicrobiota bacterium]
MNLRRAIRAAVMLLAVASADPLLALGWRASLLATSPAMLAFAGSGIGWLPNPALIDVNPAHVWGIASESVGYGHLRMFGDLRGSVVTWQGHYRGSPTQLRLRTMSEEGIELRGDIPTTEPLGLISASLMSATLTRGRQLLGGQLGMSITGAYQRIYYFDARGLWFSAGWSRQLSSRVSLGAAITRIGLGETLTGDTFSSLPWKAGAGIMLVSPLLGRLGIDVNYDADFGAVPAAAWESGGDMWVVRIGAQALGDEYRLAFGLGFDLENWSVGYALSYQNSALGLPQMFQASRKF